MVSNESTKVSPYELFQELLSINTERQQLKARINVLDELAASASTQLVGHCMGEEPTIDQTGAVYLDGQCYHYSLDIEAGTVEDFYPVSVIKPS